MAVVKKSSSGKQVQFIDDTGVIHFTSTTYLANYLNQDKVKISVLKRYAVPLPSDKFPKSEVYDPTGAYAKVGLKSSTGHVDTLTKSNTKDLVEEKAYTDAKVW